MKRFLSAVSAFVVSLCIVPISTSAELFCDANNDGVVNAADATCILQYAAYVGAGGELSLSAYMSYEANGEVPPTSVSSFADSADSKEYIEKLSEIIDINDVHYLIDPEQYGALDAYMFKYSGKQFYIYHFSDNNAILEEAESGKVIMKPIDGSYRTEFESSACCNGNFILLYTESDDAVTSAFMQ